MVVPAALLVVMLSGTAAPAAAASQPAADVLSRELPSTPEQEDALLKAAGDGFQLRRTPHFLIAHNVADADVRPFISRVEHTYQSVFQFARVNNIAVQEPAARLEIIYFDEYDQYQAYARRYVGDLHGTYGFYYEPTNRAAFYNVDHDPGLNELRQKYEDSRQSTGDIELFIRRSGPPGQPVRIEYQDGSVRVLSAAQAARELASARETLRVLKARLDTYAERINRTVVQHETAHQVFFNAGVHVRGGDNPVWLVEGLAMLFETPPTEAGTGVGTINQMRLRDLRDVLTTVEPNRHPTAEIAIRAMQKRVLIPLPELIQRPELLRTRGELGSRAYAEAWALVHYLHRVRTDGFAAYIAEIAKRPKGVEVSPDAELELFRKYLGEPDDVLVRRWMHYILALGVTAP